MPQTQYPTKTIALLGGTGKVGGFVLLDALRRGHNVRALARSAKKLAMMTGKFPNQLTVVEGSSSDPTVLKDLITLKNGGVVGALICCLGSPNKTTLIMNSSAKALVVAYNDLLRQPQAPANPPRTIWISSVGVNDAIPQAKMFGCKDTCCPSCNTCCGYGCFGCMQMCCLIPCIIGQPLWDDMGYAEDTLTHPSVDGRIKNRLMIVRPTNMDPPDAEMDVFSEKWEKTGGSTAYQAKASSDTPPTIWITRRAIAAFMLDALHSRSCDGKRVSLFQGVEGTHRPLPFDGGENEATL